MNIKHVLFLCLSLAFTLAAPVQSQTAIPTPPTATPLPTAPFPRPVNPNVADFDDCGLPATYSRFNSAATVTTFNMTSDCTFNLWGIPSWGGAYMVFSSGGEFTINGNGHSIIGPTASSPNTYAIWIEDANTILNLNNVTIRQTGGTSAIRMHGGRLNGRRLTFIDNIGTPVLDVRLQAQAYLENVRFLDNSRSSVGSMGIRVEPGGFVDINNAIIRGNTGQSNFGYLLISRSSTLQLRNYLTFEDNFGLDGMPTGLYSVIGDGQFIRIPPPKPKTATPRPSTTPRPAAMTCIDLHEATGISVYATFGLGSGIQCQQLNGGGVGIASIVEAGFIDAVDIWGYADQGIEVCFPQSGGGRLLFLDARTIPRAISPLESYIFNGMTCGWIESPGSIVLMPHP